MCYNEIMINRIIVLLGLVAVAVILAMMNMTTPSEVGPLGVLVFFTTVYILMFGIALILVWGVRKAMGRKAKFGRKEYVCGAVVAFAPIMLLLVQSFAAVNWWAIVLAGVFAMLGCTLVYKWG